MADLANEEKPAIAPPVFVFQKNEKGQKEKLEPMTSTTPPSNKRPVDASSPEDAEDSDRDDGNYPPPVKRERSSSFTQVFPPAQPVPKNNVFMPLSFCQAAASNSDSEPDEKNVGFRLKPPTLIHGQAPSAGLPSQKSKEQQRSVLRPAVLQPPQQKSFTQNVASSGTNGVSKQTEEGITAPSVTLNNTSDEETTPINSSAATPSYMENTKLAESSESKSSCEVDEKEEKLDSQEQPEQLMEQTNFVFGENLQDRVKMMEGSDFTCPLKQSSADGETLPATNYFLQYIKQNTVNLLDSGENADSNARSAKFVFGENMSERVLSLPRAGDVSIESNKEQLFGENVPVPSGSLPEPLPEATPEKATDWLVNNVTESLEESAAAYTKATAKKCLLEKVEVITGEEAESNVLQIQCKLFVFDKTSQSWVERGRGLLRLNDMASADDGALQSRLVMRTQGSLRLILNTKLWAQMQIDKASEKSIRITAMDAEDQGVKVFLISASSKDAGQLYAALHHRILALRSRCEQEPEPPCIVSEAGVTQSNEEDSDDDDEVIVPATATSGPCDTDDKQTTGST
ncbi:ran-binding protein 3-like isoform X1 [Chiloscyllium plagiosum]|uniref:ran-binding protein 3-like isoform X1 n=3 Tax=Chiloscyllium plagiosum TaxID=36176 RepID=UPI001CB854E1|nr:ran-binding protein 3-like isoform X1 [Chiloscyllium plagiosum]